MRPCFLLECGYAPYSKWIGSAFGRLAAAGDADRPARAAVRGCSRRSGPSRAQLCVVSGVARPARRGPQWLDLCLRPFQSRAPVPIGLARTRNCWTATGRCHGSRVLGICGPAAAPVSRGTARSRERRRRSRGRSGRSRLRPPDLESRRCSRCRGGR
ncbi:MAG: hypothetical protein DLM71_00075 [Chloroflexi bacterium]|nr:MAG: hypothetical protein DLM71_00075 [Chloroflexota bacterium]